MNKICRICLEEGVLSSIFERNYNITLCDMIEYCCNVKISKNDGLPEQLCSNCAYKLGIAYHFKQSCESADIRLRQYLGLSMPNKFNDVAVMTDPAVVPTNLVKVEITKCLCSAAPTSSTKYRSTSSNYRRKPESEMKKRGPKPKPKRVHACYECHKEFRCHTQLEMHMRTHTGDRPFGCEYCERRFTQKHNLAIHLRTHTGEKPYQCEVCSKRFSAQGNLQNHIKTHTGQKDHPCTLCDKAFTTSSELTRHMRKHRGVKDHKCDVCGVGFVQSRDLNLHKLKKHQIDVKKEVLQKRLNGTNLVKDSSTQSSTIALPKESIVNAHIPHPSTDTNQMDGTLQSEDRVESQKDMKHVFVKYSTDNLKHSCTVCGEQFEYLHALAQHYPDSHKGYEAYGRLGV